MPQKARHAPGSRTWCGNIGDAVIPLQTLRLFWPGTDGNGTEQARGRGSPLCPGPHKRKPGVNEAQSEYPEAEQGQAAPANQLGRPFRAEQDASQNAEYEPGGNQRIVRELGANKVWRELLIVLSSCILKRVRGKIKAVGRHVHKEKQGGDNQHHRIERQVDQEASKYLLEQRRSSRVQRGTSLCPFPTTTYSSLCLGKEMETDSASRLLLPVPIPEPTNGVDTTGSGDGTASSFDALINGNSSL